jgi:uncharacterized membrane protein HdeD (DUF308 family)
MEALELEDERATEATRSPVPWWLFLVTGVAWLIAALIILRFDVTSITAVGVLVGVVLALGTVAEVAAALAAPVWRWAHWILALLFAIGSIWSFVHPIGAFWELASVLGFLLVFKGSFDIIRGVLTRPVNEVWWLGVAAGIIEVLLAFWVSQQFFAPRAALIIVWVGFSAILRGIGEIALAFDLRRLERDVRA